MQNITTEEVYPKLFRSLCKTKRLSLADRKAFMARTAITSFKANEKIVVEGTLSTHSYFIISGLIMCYEGDNFKYIKWFRAEESYAFTTDKFKYGKPGRVNNDSLMALEDTLVVSMSHEDYLWLCTHHPMIAMLEAGLILGLGNIMSGVIACFTVEGRKRYEWLEEQMGFNLERIPDVHLVPYLQTTVRRLKDIRKSGPVSFLKKY